MKISVVIPAFNEAKLLAGSLASVRQAITAFTAAGWDAELIVCDNNSTDATPDLARAARARVVFEPVNQIARARNSGAAAATGDWLIFIDADSYPTPELFGAVLREIQSGRCLGGGSTVRMDLPRVWGWVGLWLWNGVSRVMRWAAGSFIFCETAAFWRLGGFNQELFASEEIDFSKRLRREASRERKKMLILRDHPLLTSGRKLHLYSWRDYLRLLYQTVRHRGANLKDRDRCRIWYDGRR
jgi:glycosyltransferase involved in cell wall biosynthesis